jgi:glucosamine 6-phosphate synthetase-like amidotransferase/phosphosugar isomerase protein
MRSARRRWSRDYVSCRSWCARRCKIDPAIEALSSAFIQKHHALFLGRGIQYPIAMEGALKLKEISYIHAEAYPAGSSSTGPWRWSMRTCPWWPSRPRTSFSTS